MTNEQPETLGVHSFDEFKGFEEEWSLLLDHFGKFVVKTGYPLYRMPHDLLKLLSGWINPDELRFETAVTMLCDRFHSVGILPDRVIPYTLLAPVE
ncbi:MAG: hypothetical protein COA78_16160 [Blastopirellula sp.]|nr:MAG: hypothetical protein COA78_16160 [Blastopirellula sp.]